MKRIAVLTAVAMLAFGAAACGGSSDGTTTGGTTATGTQATSEQAATYQVTQLMQSSMSTGMSNLGNPGGAQVVKNLKSLGFFKDTGVATIDCDLPTMNGTSETMTCNNSCPAASGLPNGSMEFTFPDVTQLAGDTVTIQLEYTNFSYDCIGSLTGEATYTMTMDTAALQAAEQNANSNCTYSYPTGTNACWPETISDSEVNDTLSAYGCQLSNTACPASSAILSIQGSVIQDMVYTRSDCTPPTTTVGAGSTFSQTICGTFLPDANCHSVYDATLDFTGTYNGQSLGSTSFNMSCDTPTDLANYQP